MWDALTKWCQSALYLKSKTWIRGTRRTWAPIAPVARRRSLIAWTVRVSLCRSKNRWAWSSSRAQPSAFLSWSSSSKVCCVVKLLKCIRRWKTNKRWGKGEGKPCRPKPFQLLLQTVEKQVIRTRKPFVKKGRKGKETWGQKAFKNQMHCSLYVFSERWESFSESEFPGRVVILAVFLFVFVLVGWGFQFIWCFIKCRLDSRLCSRSRPARLHGRVQMNSRHTKGHRAQDEKSLVFNSFLAPIPSFFSYIPRSAPLQHEFRFRAVSFL